MRGQTGDSVSVTVPYAWAPQCRIPIAGVLKGRWCIWTEVTKNQNHLPRLAGERIIEYLVLGCTVGTMGFAISWPPYSETRALLFVALNRVREEM